MVVRDSCAVFINAAAQNSVGERVAGSGDVAPAIDEVVRALGGFDGVHHDGKIAGGGVFHAGGDIHGTCSQTVLLVFDRARADGFVGQKVIQIAAVFRVQHFVCACEAGLFNGAHVHFADGDDAAEQVRGFIGVRLVQHALVALARGAGLIGVDAWNENEAVFHLLVHTGKAAGVFADAFFVIRRAGADDDEKFIGLSAEHGGNLFIARGFDFFDVLRDGKFGFEGCRVRQLFVNGHGHRDAPLITRVLYFAINRGRWLRRYTRADARNARRFGGGFRPYSCFRR